MIRTDISVVFKARRQELMNKHPDDVFIFSAPKESVRNHDVYHPFRQESSFFYLSSFEEPESFLVLSNGKSILFVRSRNIEKEIWEGERYGVDRAKQIFSMDETYPVEDFAKELPRLLAGANALYHRLNLDEPTDRTILEAIEKAKGMKGRTGAGFISILDPSPVMGEMRLFKSPEEIISLRKACEISAQAHNEALRATRPGMNEYEIEALIDFQFRSKGCARNGYGSIVAGGKNATCLHYRANNEVLRDGDLLLIDAGGEYDYYSADITRTFPVGREFSKEQREIYKIVLDCQKQVIETVRPGLTYSKIHELATELLVDGLLDLGLFTGNRDALIKDSKQKRLYPHGTGHWLGQDVHDVGLYNKNNQSRPLEPGMVFTIEPGIYIQPGDLEAPEHYRGIGIRIEDDILVTPNGYEVLTKSAIKEISEIENLRR